MHYILIIVKDCVVTIRYQFGIRLKKKCLLLNLSVNIKFR